MTEIRPFRALRYDPARVDLAEVLAPVYDVVAPEDRAVYYDRHPYNALRLELTRTEAEQADTDYSEIADQLARWRGEGVLALDQEPACYVLRQRFTAPDGRELARISFYAALHLESYDRRIVRPHERTLEGPKADRLKILRATRTNLSSVLMLYEDRDLKLADLLDAALGSAEAVSVEDDAGIEHTLAPLREPAAIEQVQGFLAERPVVIADGHHRYETALAYRNECRAAGADDEPAEFILACFANAFAPGSLLLPIHRLVKGDAPPPESAWERLGPEWSEERHPLDSAAAVPEALARHLAPLSDRFAFAADDGGGSLRVFSRPADGELSVRVIHDEVLQRVFGLDDEAVRRGAVAFPKSALQTAQDVRSGRGSVALYLNPLLPDDVFRVTEAGETLPQKSTFFHPKLPTGLLFRVLEPGT